jgi:pilus assembly protein Flp/PilA
LRCELPTKRGFQLTSDSNFILRRVSAGQTPVLSQQEFKRMSLISRFLRDDTGATAIEYGLIAAGISVAIIATVLGVGSKLDSTFTAVKNNLQ